MDAGAVKRMRVGLVGGGTVGGGIVEMLAEKEVFLRDCMNAELPVTAIAVRDPSVPRSFEVPAGVEVTSDWESVVNDPNVDIVVEVMGGTTLAREVIEKALRAGKSVVTANKALIADQLPELQAILAETTAEAVADGRTPPRFGFEAAVCGGIPVIHVMQHDLAGDSVTRISGIMNGCTNFMLTGMDRDKLSYAEVLKEASDLGYAEADPTLDVGGFDARSKLKILIKLAFGVDIEENRISCAGIPEVEKVDFEYAKMEGGTVKLLAVAGLDASGKELSAFVSPCFVKETSTLATIQGATNAVQVESSRLGTSTLIGQGAGRFPTANSCVSDIIAIARGTIAPQPFAKANSDGLEFSNDFESQFYLRIRYSDKVGIIKDLGKICEKHGVSIYSLLQNPIGNRDDATFVALTDTCKRSQIKSVATEIEHMAWAIGMPFIMPIME